MKFPLVDVIVIVLITILLLIVRHYFAEGVIEKFSVIVALICYFVGKYFGRREMVKK